MTTPASPVLALQDVRVLAGGREVLRVDHFEVAAGKVVAVLGPNGSGKSTLLRSAALLIEPASGHLRLVGREPGRRRGRTELVRRTASVFTDPTLLDMSVRANVEVALRLHGAPRAERRHRAEAWLNRLDVLRLARARPHTLSAGEAQRVALARAFAVGPELLFLDEPFASLDFDTRAGLVGDLREVLASGHAAAVIATHDRSEAAILADELAVLLDGRIAQSGPAAEVFEHPQTAAVASFLGHTLIEREHVTSLLPDIVPRGDLAYIPPGAVQVVAAGTDGAVGTRIITVGGAGGRLQLLCDFGAPATVEVSASSTRISALRPGELVYLRIDRGRVYWMDERLTAPSETAWMAKSPASAQS
jgi:tungstate transport system ATP-binding protein